MKSTAVALGMRWDAIAGRFAVSRSSVDRWVAQAAASGSRAALPMGGKKPFTQADEAEWIAKRLTDKPDITGRELLAELHERQVDVSHYGVWHFLDHTGLSFEKKSACQ